MSAARPVAQAWEHFIVRSVDRHFPLIDLVTHGSAQAENWRRPGRVLNPGRQQRSLHLYQPRRIPAEQRNDRGNLCWVSLLARMSGLFPSHSFGSRFGSRHVYLDARVYLDVRVYLDACIR
jgi:hypothetical protein